MTIGSASDLSSTYLEHGQIVVLNLQLASRPGVPLKNMVCQGDSIAPILYGQPVGDG